MKLIRSALVLAVAIAGLVLAASASAQTAAGRQTATVTANAPIYIGAEVSPTPLRVAAPGTVLRVLQQQGGWLQVEFNDPQWGLRVGWVRSELVTVRRPELEPMDLSIRPPQPAQEPPPPPPSQDARRSEPPPRSAPAMGRQHIVARGGVTFGTETAALAGVEISSDVLPLLQVYGSYDWHQNVAPKWVQDIGDVISYYAGADVEYRFPAHVLMGGVKIIAPRSAVRPYGVAGFGVGRVLGKVRVDGTDVTDLLDALGYLNKDDVSFTKPLFEVGGGVALSVGQGYIDASYRFRKFLRVGEPLNVSGVYLGAGVSF